MIRICLNYCKWSARHHATFFAFLWPGLLPSSLHNCFPKTFNEGVGLLQLSPELKTHSKQNLGKINVQVVVPRKYLLPHIWMPAHAISSNQMRHQQCLEAIWKQSQLTDSVLATEPKQLTERTSTETGASSSPIPAGNFHKKIQVLTVTDLTHGRS